MKRFTNKILVFLNVIVAFALALAQLSNFVNPSKIWYFALFGLAYPYLLILNLVFLGFWIWRRKKIALLSFAIIIVGAGNIGRYFQGFVINDKKDAACSIGVLTYNVRVFNHFEWEKNISARDSILNYIHSKQVSIVCLQDYLTRSNRWEQSEEYIHQKLTNLPFQHIEYTYNIDESESHFGIATYSKYPIINQGSIHFSHSLNACIFSDVVIDKDTVRIYNVHLQSIRLKKHNIDVIDSMFSFSNIRIEDMKDISGRLKTAFIHRSEQVDTVARHMNSSPYPIILCGDFNDTPVSYTYQKLLGKKKDSFRESGGGVGTTYRGRVPSYRIDYIFHSKNFESLYFETGKASFSDHYPVYTCLRLKTK